MRKANMSDTREIVELLKELRDIQTERLHLQRKALKEQESAQADIRNSMTLQRTSSKIQKFAALVLVLLIPWTLWLVLR